VLIHLSSFCIPVTLQAGGLDSSAANPSNDMCVTKKVI